MHVAIDLRITDAPGMEMTGAGRYALLTTRWLQRARPQWRFSLFSNRPALLSCEGETTLHATRLPTHHAAARVAWLHTVAALPALRSKPDVWFSPAFVLPLWWRGPTVVTIHDLTFLLLRDRYRGRAHAWYASAATRWSARRADRVLCGSSATREQLVTHLGIEAAKVRVIRYGVADAFFTTAGTDPDRRSDDREAPYVLFVGTWEARKGLSTLYAAVRRLNMERKRVRLVLAGQPGWGTAELIAEMRGDPNVELVEKPTDVELATLYREAVALAYPSEMEGFGLPVAEAMACGCPVIATDLPSVREFAGDHPLYLRSGDSLMLARHVEHLLNGGAGAEDRREQRRQAVSSLRWSSLGERTAAVIEQLIEERCAPRSGEP